MIADDDRSRPRPGHGPAVGCSILKSRIIICAHGPVTGRVQARRLTRHPEPVGVRGRRPPPRNKASFSRRPWTQARSRRRGNRCNRALIRSLSPSLPPSLSLSLSLSLTRSGAIAQTSARRQTSSGRRRSAVPGRIPPFPAGFRRSRPDSAVLGRVPTAAACAYSLHSRAAAGGIRLGVLTALSVRALSDSWGLTGAPARLGCCRGAGRRWGRAHYAFQPRVSLPSPPRFHPHPPPLFFSPARAATRLAWKYCDDCPFCHGSPAGVSDEKLARKYRRHLPPAGRTFAATNARHAGE